MTINKDFVFENKSEKSRKRTQRKRNPVAKYYKYSIIGGGGQNSNYELQNEDLITLRAPNYFSIAKNPYQNLKFFEKLEKKLMNGYPIFLDISKIKELNEDAVLYLISRLDHLIVKYKAKVQGNLPNDHVCRDKFLKTNFLKYVQTNIDYDENQPDIFPIHSGISATGNIVEEVLNFVKNYIDLGDDSERFYAAIMECIINTGQHAYVEMSSSSKWWMIAIPEPEKNRVHFTTLDNGYGIPATIRKNYREIFQNKFGKHIFVKSEIDCELIISALQAEHRSRTGDEHRGNGLPSLFELTTLPSVTNLRIISSHGYVEMGNDKNIKMKERLKSKFHGTMISWDFITSEK